MKQVERDVEPSERASQRAVTTTSGSSVQVRNHSDVTESIGYNRAAAALQHITSARVYRTLVHSNLTRRDATTSSLARLVRA